MRLIPCQKTAVWIPLEDPDKCENCRALYLCSPWPSQGRHVTGCCTTPSTSCSWLDRITKANVDYIHLIPTNCGWSSRSVIPPTQYVAYVSNNPCHWRAGFLPRLSSAVCISTLNRLAAQGAALFAESKGGIHVHFQLEHHCQDVAGILIHFTSNTHEMITTCSWTISVKLKNAWNQCVQRLSGFYASLR